MNQDVILHITTFLNVDKDIMNLLRTSKVYYKLIYDIMWNHLIRDEVDFCYKKLYWSVVDDSIYKFINQVNIYKYKHLVIRVADNLKSIGLDTIWIRCSSICKSITLRKVPRLMRFCSYNKLKTLEIDNTGTSVEFALLNKPWKGLQEFINNNNLTSLSLVHFYTKDLHLDLYDLPHLKKLKVHFIKCICCYDIVYIWISSNVEYLNLKGKMNIICLKNNKRKVCSDGLHKFWYPKNNIIMDVDQDFVEDDYEVI